MGLHELRPAPGATRARRRRGRGNGSGHGTFSGRGQKGQKARSKIPPWFEGGQLPLVRRLPYMRGFNNKWRVEYVPVSLDRLAGFDENAEVTPAALIRAGVVSKPRHRVKILGGGEITRPLRVSAHGFSKTAREKIEAAGGTATVIEWPSTEAANGSPE